MKIIELQWHLDTGNTCTFKVTAVEQPDAPTGKWELPEAYAHMLNAENKIHPDAKVIAMTTEHVRSIIEELWLHLEQPASPPPTPTDE
jgi:hypothetical protein